MGKLGAALACEPIIPRNDGHVRTDRTAIANLKEGVYHGYHNNLSRDFSLKWARVLETYMVVVENYV